MKMNRLPLLLRIVIAIFLGIVIGKDTLASTTLAQFFLQIRFLTNGLL